MAKELFGTDGIRGPAGVPPLDEAGVTQIGRAIATCFAQPGELIIIGRDPRQSSPELAAAIIDGLVACGARVENVGIIPTPGLAYLTKHRGAKAGVMVTASHNPYTDNGIKVFKADGGKLSDDDQAELNRLITSELVDREAGMASEAEAAIADYQAFLAAAAETVSFKDLRIALDSANGAASGLAERVFLELGADVVPLFDKPNGQNINVRCGATDTAALQATVIEQKLSAGAALDGDGDRVMLVDERGRQLTGDHLLYILAVTGKHAGVVATEMSNQGLETSLQNHDISLHRTAVGDRYVLEGLDQTGLTLGGEQSGHIILTQYAITGDGLLAAIVTLRQVLVAGKSLAAWYDELALLPQKLVNIPLADKSLLGDAAVLNYIKAAENELADSGRLNIRPSGTEPKLRIMVEAADADRRATTIAHDLSELLAMLESQSS